MNELKKQEDMTKALATMNFMPTPLPEETKLTEYSKIPLDRVTALGTSFEPLANAIKTATSSGTSGIYKVTIPKGTHLASFSDGTGNLGAALSNSTNQVAAQAKLESIPLDPTMVFMAAALANIEKKLDAIQETQKEMMEFLQQKEKSELRGNITFLSDILENYKFNWNNKLYKSSNHVLVLDIKKDAEQKIDFYRNLINDKISKKKLLTMDQDLQKQIDSVQEYFKDYQLALYMFSYAAFLEIMLLENYAEDYLSGISKKIDDYTMKYRELYTKCYNELEGTNTKTVQNYALKGLAIAAKFSGEAIAKVPVISKGQVDEGLIAASDKITEFKDKRAEKRMLPFSEKQATIAIPFKESIDKVNLLYNSDLQLAYDGENIFIGVN